MRSFRRVLLNPYMRFVLAILLLSPLYVNGQSGQPSSPSVKFEVASIKSAPNADPATGSWSLPNIGSFTAAHVSLDRLIQLAYGLNKDQIISKSSWIDSDLFDVQAKPEAGVNLSRDELKPRLQNLLSDRFHLVSHHEVRTTQGYALMVGKGGAHLTPTKGAQFPGFRIHVGGGDMQGLNWSMQQFAKYLSDASGFPVVDQTALSGSYDIGFTYNPHPDTPDNALLPLEDSLRQATGLYLKPEKIPAEVLVIDSVNRSPTDN